MAEDTGTFEEQGFSHEETPVCKEHIHKVSVIIGLTKAITSVNNFDEQLAIITKETAKLFNASGCIIRLMQDGLLRILSSYGIDTEDTERLTVGIGEGLAGRVFAEKRTILVKAGDDFGDIIPNMPAQSAVCCPLKIGSRIIGTFGLYDKQSADNTVISFTEQDIETLEGFASIAAIVIDKSMLYENALKKEREALDAQRQTEELKDYLQGLIENSADAIVTTDINGIVTSWNMGAQKIYGFDKEEAIGKFMPFVPDFLIETEKGYAERVKNNETIKDIETVRKTKDGHFIDINLTLSPIKNSAGAIIGISGIARDITEKKKIEKELIQKTSMLSRLLFISSAMRGTLEIDKLLRMVLTAVTMGDGLGFNRAMLFLIDEERGSLKGVMGVGPSSHEEAWQIWSRLSTEHKNLYTIINEIDSSPLSKDSFMDKLCCGIEIPLDSDTVLTRAVKEKTAFNITNVHLEPLSDAVLIQQLGTMAYAVSPLISRDRVIGVLWVDNLFSRRTVTDYDLEFLKGFTNQMASAIENAHLFDRVARAEQELEKIFESISDMIYVTTKDFVITRVNKAVLEMTGLKNEDIIGKKSFEVLKGFEECEVKFRQEIMSTKSPFVEELEDYNRAKAFLISCSPILSNSGELIGTVHIVRDISEIKKLREKVTSAERMAALGEMAAKVAHEIRNPLLSIGGFARRLEKRVPEDLREYAKIIVDETSRLEEILNDTLSFVKKARLDIKPIDIAEIIDNIFNLLEPAALSRGNKLYREIPRPLSIPVDNHRFKEALLNIATNANEAADHGVITVRAYEHDADNEDMGSKEAIIEIEDNGRGISEDDIARVFDPFFTTRPTGTGLGLSITKRIIEEHGGNIEVKSKQGEGTKFIIHMPLSGSEIKED
jgi:PAS domain S-box-containing protein